MPNRAYARAMARYNLWQNENLVTAADPIGDAARLADRGAFFGSIARTFSHILWGDQIWLSRFAGTEPPEGGIAGSADLYSDWEDFKTLRAGFDRSILDWAKNVAPDWFEGDLHWFSGAVGREMRQPKSLLVLQLFNHQTHHRGQIHAMLTAAGAQPGDTDVPFMPDRFAVM